MTIRRSPLFTVSVVLGCWLLLVCSTLAHAAPQESSKESPTLSPSPNVLVIVADDLGFADLGCLGSTDMQTPALDELYLQSLKLNRLYANCPVCSPTRASILTGRYPDRVGVPGVIRTNPANSWGYFAPSTPTLAGRLGQLGYRTAAIGKWHLGLRDENHPMKRGFDSFEGFLGDMMDDYFNHRRHGINYMRRNNDEIDPEGHATDLFSQWASDFISKNSDSPKPWFLYLAYNAPHTPIQPPESWLAKVKDREAGIDDKRAALVALIEHMDDGIGRVLESLRSSGQFENTIIAFTSDNGGQVNVGANNGSLRDGKGSMYEGGIRIPGCIRVPGVTKAGSSTDRVCVTMDLLPTILASVGHPAMEDSVDGVSWLPLLNNPDASLPERDVFFVRREGGVQYAGLTIEALLSRNLKLVHNFPTHSFELFDLNTDPAESKDLAKSRPKDFRNMIERLQRHVQGGGEAPWQKGAH